MPDTMPDSKNHVEIPVEIPLDSLSADTLSNILDSFIWREGTDYGAQDASHETKIKQLLAQLKKGDLKLIFDATSESVTLMTKNQWNRLSAITKKTD
jgi:uncharacterized protein YheU (UPF0270 family)